MERRRLGYTTFSQNFHRGYCLLCGKTPKIVASDADQKTSAEKIIKHMETEHDVRAAEFMGIVYENRMGRPPMSDEATETVGVRLPESVISRIPEPRSEWIRNVIIKNLPQ